MYCMVMHRFQKNRIVLLEELQELVTRHLSEANGFITRDVRRHNQKLKAIRKEIVKWVNEMTAAEKLLATERRHNAEKLKEANEAYTAHCNASQ